MQSLFKERTVYVAEPEETSDNRLVAAVSRYSFRWRTTGLGGMRVIARRVLREAVES